MIQKIKKWLKDNHIYDPRLPKACRLFPCCLSCYAYCNWRKIISEEFMENRDYLIMRNELQSLIDDLYCMTNELNQKRANHQLSRIDIDEAYDKIKDHIKYIHQLFIKDCYDIINNVYNSHKFELASASNLELIKIETQQALQRFVIDFDKDIRPLIIYKIIFWNESIEEKIHIKEGYYKDYLTIDNTGSVQQNMYFMKRYILELFGFDNLEINMQ